MRPSWRRRVILGVVGLGGLLGAGAGEAQAQLFRRGWGRGPRPYGVAVVPVYPQPVAVVPSPYYATQARTVVTAPTIVQRQYIQPAPAVETRYIQPAPVVERRLVPQPPVVERRVVQPPPVVEERVVPQPPIEERRVVQPAPIVERRLVQPPAIEDQAVIQSSGTVVEPAVAP